MFEKELGRECERSLGYQEGVGALTEPSSVQTLN